MWKTSAWQEICREIRTNTTLSPELQKFAKNTKIANILLRCFPTRATGEEPQTSHLGPTLPRHLSREPWAVGAAMCHVHTAVCRCSAHALGTCPSVPVMPLRALALGSLETRSRPESQAVRLSHLFSLICSRTFQPLFVLYDSDILEGILGWLRAFPRQVHVGSGPGVRRGRGLAACPSGFTSLLLA